MKKIIAFLLPLFAFAFNLSLNSGAETGKPYSVLQLNNENEFECVEQILAYDAKRYVCMLDDGILPHIEDTILPLMDIKYKKQDGKLFIIIMPKANSRLFSVPVELYDTTKARGEGGGISKHFSIVIDPNLSEFDKKRPNGINFAPDFSELKRPSIGALDLSRAPIEGMDSNDIDLYMNIKRSYDAGAYTNVVNDAKTALQRHPNSLFASEFGLYQLRALDKIFQNADEYDGLTPTDLALLGRAWIRKFTSDENYAEVLYLIAKAYLKEGIASDAKYMLDMLSSEHEGSKYARLAALEYSDYLYKTSKKKEAIALYNAVLYATDDIDIASRAALSLADANIDKEQFDEAKNFILKILNANEKYFMNDVRRAIDLANVFAAKQMNDVAAKIYEILTQNLDPKSEFYEVALKNAGINLAKAGQNEKAYEYLKRYEKEYKYGEYTAEVAQASDALFFELNETNSTKLHEHYKMLMEKYEGSEIGKKALVSELALDIKERKFDEALKYTNLVKEQNSTQGAEYLNEAAYELAREAIRQNDCQSAINLLESYDVNRVELPQFKLFDCYFRTARYTDALELAKANVKDENLEDRVEWLVNLSKILYQQKDYENTLRAANDALSLGARVEYSDPTPVLFDRFYALLKMKRFEEAVATLSAMEQLRGQDFKIVEAYVALAEYAFSNNDFAITNIYAAKALEMQARAKLDLFTPKMNFLNAIALMKMDNLNEALDEIKFILNLRLKPDERLRAQGLAAEIYTRLKQPSSAKKHLEECVGSNFVSPYKDVCQAQLNMMR